ncbi:3-carboxy-cis,cis-muconate cycloisomerase [Actinosynnema sp. NPDC047251]|uniref:3-carboxy-cis,cis-muconate cycloisomerase n=1 Tax=Saccharothrix espanaensis (strain ATCC 51144 / DSM 44229 / JCM 9112 / NBRC 15066 / NRRL 15764) TaxID=1179773 RepID=K0K751_SACES|nr:3-carboxy-cis,cis-muconate cycloisomerase [Saccharothrix espanaensis]CCH33372.1 3-carboxy-cis,cis-muconate cycloisomerase [Saccharothrix espanaensis DSM 44229]
MKPSSSTSELFGPLFTDPAVEAEISDRAWLRAMLDFERALAIVQARAGIVSEAAARMVVTAIDVGRYDPAALGEAALTSGTPVVPLVKAIGAHVTAEGRTAVHNGATSQDVLDTALSLVAFRALGPVLDALAGVAGECERLARRHRDTLIAGRTLAQHALPTTFGLKCAGWLVAVDEAADALDRVRERRLAVQFGGAAGTLAAVADPDLTDQLAAQLGLAAPLLPWHTDRTRVAELACALGGVSGVLAKIAQDVVLLAQTEVAEVAEGEGGTSSAMPHKHNPVRAVLVTAGTRRVPGLVSTVLSSMAQEHERAAGAWHSEWQTVTELLRLVGGAAHGVRELLSRLRVDPDRMRRNLELTGGLLMAENVAGRLAARIGRTEAQELVAEVCRAAALNGRTLRQALLADLRIDLSEQAVDEALDPAGYVGSAGEFVDRALAAHRGKGDR